MPIVNEVNLSVIAFNGIYNCYIYFTLSDICYFYYIYFILFSYYFIYYYIFFTFVLFVYKDK